MSTTKYLLLNWYSPMKKKIRKIQMTLKVKSNFGTFWQLPSLVISFNYSWCLAKNLSDFISLPWKLHNRYCHTVSSPQTFKNVQFTRNYFATLVLLYCICDKNENMSLLRNIIWILLFSWDWPFLQIAKYMHKKSVFF